MDSNDSVKSEILDDPPGGSLISRLSASVNQSANQNTPTQKTTIKRENVTGSQFTKGHSRSKSQTLTSFTNPENADQELSKHFERSLSQNIHAKSKSLPRPMAGLYIRVLKAVDSRTDSLPDRLHQYSVRLSVNLV